MNIFGAALLCTAIFVIGAGDVSGSDIVAGYVPGLCGMTPINEKNCMNDALNSNPSLSNALECARTCTGDKPKTCYYKFVVERYPASGQACNYCNPDCSTYICSNCQCVLADGVQRSILSVNRMLPGPSIQVCLGDLIVVDVVNKMLEEHVTVHWHGVFQHGTQYYDGVPFVTQCPIPSGDTFRYQFYANNSGTHFWHSHVGLQKMNGLAGSLIVREPAEKDPNSNLYDYDLASHVVFITDWMLEDAVERFPGRTAGIIEQLPDDLLINGRGRNKSEIATNAAADIPLEVIQVEANNRYRFRMVNAFCTTCSGELTIQGHDLTVIATDGESVKPVTVSSIVSYAGERYDFVINTNQRPGAYWIQLRGLEQCDQYSIQQLAILQYVNAPTTPFTEEPTYDGGLATGVVLNPTTGNCEAAVKDAICVNQLKKGKPTDATLLKAEPDQRFYLPIAVIHYDQEKFFQPNMYNKFLVPMPIHTAAQLMNGIVYDNAPVPMLSQLEDLPKDQFCDADHLPQGCSANCSCTHVIDVQLNATVEMIFVDEFKAPRIEHPMHLHGYSFYVVSMGQPLGESDDDTANTITVDYVKQLDANNQIKRNLIDPPKKDTIVVPNNGFAIIRFHANNPGFWMLHCHFAYHQESGMEMVMRVGNQLDLPPKPTGFPKCGNFVPEIIDIN